MVTDIIPQERTDFYVYVIFRLDGTPCYVGKGQRGRWKQHVYRSHNKELKRIYAEANGDLPISKIRESLSNAEACELEMILIITIGRANFDGGPLVNLTDGGEGSPGYKHSLESLAKLKKPKSEAHKKLLRIAALKQMQDPEMRAKSGAPKLGKKASDATRALMSKNRKGVPKTPDHVEKVAATHRGSKRTEETKKNIGFTSRNRSPESNAKISRNLKAYFAAKKLEPIPGQNHLAYPE